MAGKYEMGEMPEAPESESDELSMEGADFESPEEEVSPVEDIKSQIAGLDKDSLKELEAAVADELSKAEEDSEEASEEESPEAPEGKEPAEEEAAGGLGAMFS